MTNLADSTIIVTGGLRGYATENGAMHRRRTDFPYAVRLAPRESGHLEKCISRADLG